MRFDVATNGKDGNFACEKLFVNAYRFGNHSLCAWRADKLELMITFGMNPLFDDDTDDLKINGNSPMKILRFDGNSPPAIGNITKSITELSFMLIRFPFLLLPVDACQHFATKKEGIEIGFRINLKLVKFSSCKYFS